MPTSPEARRLVFPDAKQVVLETFVLPDLGSDEVRIRIERSLMSTGTENIVFNRLFDAGTHWDRWVKYPFHPGYAAVGIVEAMAPGVASPRLGERVVCRCPHQSMVVMKAVDCFPVPAAVAPEEAVWSALAKIAFHGARAAAYSLGDTVLVIGAGPIGQMSVRWARAAGAQTIVAADMVPGRLALAEKGGATSTVAVPIAEAKEAILRANGGNPPRVVIDSTGNAAVFASALGISGHYGTVVILGDTGSPAQQALTPDVIQKGLRIVGAHDVHNTPEWNQATITRLFLSLAASGRFPLQGLTSHRFAPEECAAAYETANRDRASTMGILFTWSE